MDGHRAESCRPIVRSSQINRPAGAGEPPSVRNLVLALGVVFHGKWHVLFTLNGTFALLYPLPPTRSPATSDLVEPARTFENSAI